MNIYQISIGYWISYLPLRLCQCSINIYRFSIQSLGWMLYNIHQMSHLDFVDAGYECKTRAHDLSSNTEEGPEHAEKNRRIERVEVALECLEAFNDGKVITNVL